MSVQSPCLSRVGFDSLKKINCPIGYRSCTKEIENCGVASRKKTSSVLPRCGYRVYMCVRACNVVVYQFRGPGRLRVDRKSGVIGAHGRICRRRVARKFDRARRVLRKSRGPSIVLCVSQRSLQNVTVR